MPRSNNPFITPPIAPADFHLFLETSDDDRQVRINSRDFSQTSGNSIAFQAKPSQTATTTGEVIGAEISPRVQSGIGFGVLKGLHIDVDMKGTSGGNGTDVRVLELEAVDAGVNTRTVSGDVAFIRFRSNLSTGTLSGDQTIFKIEAHEGSQAWDAFVKAPASSGLSGGTITDALPANTGWIRVKLGSTFGKVPVYAD